MIKFLKEPFLQTEGYFGQEILILGVLKINDDIFIDFNRKETSLTFSKTTSFKWWI